MPVDQGRHTTTIHSTNKFVQIALGYALTYSSAVNHAKIGPTSITILADTDYYSHSGSSGSDIPPTSDRFVDFNVPLHDAHKTGLGSSAALVTALTTAIVAHYVPEEVTRVSLAQRKSRLHNLAQAAHCAAQGKVGSGFDVAAATFGSCVYKRFSPSILEELDDIGTNGFSTRLRSVVEDTNPSGKWDTGIDKSMSGSMPKGLRLIMCDVDCGSETVGMVKNVLLWKKEHPEEALVLWRTLQEGNEDLAKQLRQSESRRDYNTPPDHESLRTIILTIRSLIREMSAKSGVPIEPQVQTDLIDACCEISDVVGGVVPGAGGYDATALLVHDRPDVIDSLHRFLENYRVEANGSQGGRIGKVRLLGVRQDDEGIKEEDPMQYKAWLR